MTTTSEIRDKVTPLRATSVSVEPFVPPSIKQLRNGLNRWSVFNLLYDQSNQVHPGQHSWKDALITEDEDEIKQRRNEHDRPFDKETDTYCIIVVGTTGAGKSSVAKLFCGDDVKTSSNTISCTKTSTLYAEVGDNRHERRQWLDTQGTDDSDMFSTDERILKRIFKKLYEQKIREVIIVWMIAGDMDRQKGEYLKQASFIQGFQTSTSTSTIWSSCIIIQKLGQLQPKLKQIRGVIDACKNHGADDFYVNEDIIHNYVMGFKCTDWINLKDDDVYETLIESETGPTKMEMLGYVNSAKMKRLIHEKLETIPCFRLDFDDKVCDKCGIRGDPRYLYYKCHHSAIPRHPKGLIPFHDNVLEYYHPLNTHIIHSGQIKHYHPGSLQWFHPSELVEMHVKDKDNPIYYHDGDYQSETTGFACCKQTITKYTCCSNTDENSKGCKTRYDKKKIYKRSGCCQRTQPKLYNDADYLYDANVDPGCTRRYNCCNRIQSQSSAAANHNHEHDHKAINIDPCVSEWDCCNAEPNSVGCRTTYLCCEFDENQQGCEQRYICCKMPNGARGCKDKYECCDKVPDSKGCETVCNHCGVLWGSRPGCSWMSIQDDGDDDDDLIERQREMNNSVNQHTINNRNNRNDDDTRKRQVSFIDT